MCTVNLPPALLVVVEKARAMGKASEPRADGGVVDVGEEEEEVEQEEHQ